MDRPELEKAPSPEDSAQLNRNRSFKSKLLVRSQAIRESQSPPRTISPSLRGNGDKSPAPEYGDKKSPAPEYGDTKKSPAPEYVDCKNSPIPEYGDIQNSPVPEYGDNIKSPIPEYGDNIKSPIPEYGAIKNSPTPEYGDNKKSPIPEYGDKLQAPEHCEGGRKPGGGRRREDVRKSASDSNVTGRRGDAGKEGDAVQQVEIQITAGARDSCAARRRCAARPELLSHGPRVACVCGRRARACLHCRGRRRWGGGGGCPAKQDSGIGCSQDCPDCVESPDILVSPADDPLEQTRLRAGHKSGSLDDAEFCRCQEKKERIPKMASLGRTDSEEKKELNPEQLVAFLRDTLNKSVKDRVSLLKIERDLISLVNDPGRCVVRFPSVTSYGRMLIHRCAQLFELRHTLDHSNKSTVLVSKTGTCGGRIPCTGFRQWCTEVFPPSPQRQQDAQAKSILKRDAHSLDEAAAGGAGPNGAGARSKSFEQREEEYERTRRRIFSSEDGRTEEAQWPWLPTGPVKLLTPESADKHGRLIKVHSLEGQGPAAARGAVSKSHSFGGYGREESRPRILSRQGDLASSSWRLSPSSSGYKTLSFRSTDSVTPSPTGGVSPEPAADGALVWAVSDLSSIPRGALIIHPQTGRPLTNPDGTIYHYDPEHPPNIADAAVAPPADVKVDLNAEKRRGRLEKQNSFIDPDCECQSDGYANENCCSCCEARSQIDWSYQCYHTNQDAVQTRPKNQHQTQKNPDQSALPQQDNLKTNSTEKETNLNTERSNFEPTNQESAPANLEIQIQNRQVLQNGEAENRTTGLVYEATNQVEDGGGAVKRTVDDSYQYASDYGPSLNNDMVHYTIPYYQNQNYRINEEVQLQPQTVTSPGFVHEPPMQHAVQNKPTAVPYDPTLRPLSLGGLMYQPNVTQLGYPYTNHCRMEPPPQPHMYAEPHVEPKPSPYADPYYRATEPCDPAGAPQCLAAHRGFGLSYGAPLEQHQMSGYPVANMLLPQATQPAVHPYQYTSPNQWPSWQPLLTAPAAAPAAHQKPATPPGLYAQPEPYRQPYAKPELVGYQGVYPVLQYSSYGYPQYSALVQQMMPHSIPICHPLYPMVDRQSEMGLRRGGLALQRARCDAGAKPKMGSAVGSARSTPLDRICTPPVEVETPKPIQMYPPPYEPPEQASPRRAPARAELASAVRRIGERMARADLHGGASDRPLEGRIFARANSDARAIEPETPRLQRHNSGGGLLGSYPAGPLVGGATSGAHDGSQLTPAARAIVQSLLQKQSRASTNTLHQENPRKRYDQPAAYQSQSQRYPGQYRHGDQRGYQGARRQHYERTEPGAEVTEQAETQQGPAVPECSRVQMPEEAARAPEAAGAVREGRREARPEGRSQDMRAEQGRGRGGQTVPYQYGRPYVFRQMSAGSWCRRSPAPAPPAGFNPRYGPRRPAPDTRRR